MAKILLLTDFSSGYSRNLLKGIVRYSKEVGNWSFQRMPLYYRMLYGENGVVEWAKKWQADAIIAQLTDVNIELLNDLNIPIIVQNYRDRNKAVSNLTGDYFNTGVMAAKFFLTEDTGTLLFMDLRERFGQEKGPMVIATKLKNRDISLQSWKTTTKTEKSGATIIQFWETGFNLYLSL